MELLPSPRILLECGYGINGSKNFRSASSFPVVGHGGRGCVPAVRPRQMSLVSVVSLPALSLSCSRKCSFAPNFNLEDPNLCLGSGRPLPNWSISNASASRGKLRTACFGNLPRGGRRKVVREVVIIPSQSRASRGLRALSKTYSLAIPTIPFELRQRRSKKSNLFKVLNTSASSVLSWLRTKRRVQEIRPGTERHLSTGFQWTRSWRSFFLLNSTTLAGIPLYRAMSGAVPRLGGAMYGPLNFRCNSSLSVSSQAEGNGSLENTIVLTEGLKERQDQYEQQQQSQQKQKQASSSEQILATGYGWRVREVDRAELRELMRVADIQTAAFHEPVAMFDELFHKIFHAEVLSSLQYKARHSAPDRYSCLLAERDPSQAGYDDMVEDGESELVIVGAVDCTALTDREVVCLLPGAEEYLYISGMAVDSNYRRRSVATLLLEACLARAWQWGFDYLVLHAYEDDLRARSLYSRAGYLTIASDPAWMSKFLGRRRRVIMAKRTHQLPEC